MKLITWNVQWCRGMDGRVDPRRIVREARALADFDLLCLQEVAANFPELDGAGRHNQFEAIARLLPQYQAIPGAAVDVLGKDGSRRAFGNMILSRYPVHRALRFQLPWPSDPQQPSMPRMLLEATIATPLGPLRVGTTHLEYYSVSQRAAQVEALRARHAEASAHAVDPMPPDKEGGPFALGPQSAQAILTADFNFKPEDPLHARLQAPFDDGRTPVYRDAWQALYPGLPHPHTLGVHGPERTPYACDFVFVTPVLAARLKAVRVDGRTRASDHQPVVVEFDT